MTLDRQEHQGDAISELQNLNTEILAGNVAASTKMDVAAIRAKDTIQSALLQDLSTGLLSDDTANFSITDIRASGTLTVAVGNGALDGEFFTVGDQVFTFVAGLTSVRKLVHSGGANLPVGVDDDATAANIAEAINLVYGRDKVFGVVATVATNVVTVTARQEGTVGNSIVLTENATDLAAVAMAGGSDTGGVQTTTDTSAGNTFGVLLNWYQKQHELSPK